VEEGIAITAQEAWLDREIERENEREVDHQGSRLQIPKYVQEVIERIAFAARDDKKIDKRSGVSQRLPISAIENVVSNAERRALTHNEKLIVPRISDIYAALPAITGKLELEYEGEMKGADFVSRELIRTAVAKAFDSYLHGVNLSQVVQWFDLGGEIQLSDNAAAQEVLEGLRQIQGLMEKLSKLNVGPKDSAEMQVSAAEFILEGLHAHKKIGRNEERVFTAGEKPVKIAEKQQTFERDDSEFGRKRGFN
jgi:magnesium chelatase subunit I